MLKFITLAAVSALALAAVSRPALARNSGGAIAAGVIGGLAVGAIVGSQVNQGYTAPVTTASRLINRSTATAAPSASRWSTNTAATTRAAFAFAIDTAG